MSAWIWVYTNQKYFLTKTIDVSNSANIIKERQNYTMYTWAKFFPKKVKKLEGTKYTQLFPYVPPGLNRSSWFNVWRYKNYIGIFNCFIYAFQTSFGPNSEEFCQKLA